MRLRLLIVDDEPAARAGLVHLLAHALTDAALWEADNGVDAARLLREHRPHLLFLDVHMPGMTGLELMRDLPADARPVTVFVTAHRDHAVDAFEVAAADYLVKPFRRARFDLALARALARLALPAPAATAAAAGARPSLRFKDGAHTLFVPRERLHWAAGAGNYVELHTGDGTHLVRGTLTGLEADLADPAFVRIHRSMLVNRQAIRRVTATAHGDYTVTLEDGTALPLSRRRRHAVALLVHEAPPP